MTAYSAADLRALAPKGLPAILNSLAPTLGPVLAKYGIDTPLRFAHFIAQAAHETDGFKTLIEYGSEAYFNKRYGPQTSVGKRLGNIEPGDGARFRGRGIFQCTGRANYRFYGQKIGIDLVGAPDMAAQPANSLAIACEYWKAKGLNALADRDDIEGITRKINGGLNGLADRKAYLAKAKKIWPATAAPRPVTSARADPLADIGVPAPAPLPDAPIALEAPPPLAESKTVLGAITAVSGSGALGVLSYVQNPYALAAFALVVAAAGFIIWQRARQRKAFGT
ncbi:hypothetical protein OSH11_11580 [Kaistia dalseonensis]|uniref:Chitinase n=1 Tax=Kaistia dalseonensis TaxID=410840 RepID=A0ABU0H8Z1_9HYPH|nr:glycoside hydrolase family 19 protein [Kaistia dalseonensis]MCX5495350.1 hypothetical protein [Kaistia dalseonensis]MDQ0437936.1 putative chitinase [Kaistia dalseonensis]